MKTAKCKTRISLFLVAGLLMLAGILTNARLAVAQPQEACPLTAGLTPVAPPQVTAQQVEDGTGSLTDFALSSRDRFREQAVQATTPGQTQYFACLIRQEQSPWNYGSTYLVTLTHDGRVFIHAKDMSLSGRKLKFPIYRGILQALGINPADLMGDAAAVRRAFAAAEAGNGGSFNFSGVPGASGYATAYTTLSFRTPAVLLAGFDLDEIHLAEERIDPGDPAVTAADVVDRASLKAFVKEAGNYFMTLVLTGDPAAVSKARIAMRDPNGPWRHGSVYLYVWNLTSRVILFHAGFPDTYELQPLVPVARDAVTGEFILPQLIKAAESGPEGGFVEYHFDDPTDDTDSVDIPKVGYVRTFSRAIQRADGSTRQVSFVVGSGFYGTASPVAEGENTVIESVLPQVMRAMTASTVDAVSSRIGQATSDSAPAASFSFGGASTLSDVLLANRYALENNRFDLGRLLANSSFVLPLNAAAKGGGLFGNLTFWGSGDYRGISGGNSQSVEYDGNVTSGNLGIDAKLGADVLAGVALTRAQGSVDYTGSNTLKGELTTSLTSINPYMGWQMQSGMNLWATAGFGWGEVEIDDEAADAQASDLTQRMLAVGASGRLLTSDQIIGGGATNLKLKGEAAFTWADVDDSGTIEAASLTASRQRLMLEGEHVRKLASGATFTPSLEIGLRNDDGDGETGTGVEAGGAVRYTDAASRLTVEGRVRTLLSHGGDYEETGVSGLVRIAPGGSGQGLSFVVQPAWGETASGLRQLWKTGGNARASRDNQARLNAEVGYGLAAAQGVVTPYAGFGLAGEGARSWRMGARWKVAAYASVNVEGILREATNDDRPEHGVILRGALRW